MFTLPVISQIYHFLKKVKGNLNSIEDITTPMLYENGSLDATFAAAAGEDTALMAELRSAFSESLAHQVDLLKRSRCDGNWNMAALRIKGLGASFHAHELISLADRAIESAPGDPAIIRRIEAFLTNFNDRTA